MRRYRLPICRYRTIFEAKFFLLVYSWILSRRRELSWFSQEEVNQIIDSILDLNHIYFHQTDQTDDGCFYFPEPSPDQLVEFIGPCDDSIPVVENFDIPNVRICL